MKKRFIILPVVILLVAAVAVGLFADFNAYQNGTRTLPCEDDGIIFSITTFDGDGEGSLFVTCLGHAWVSLDNRSGHPIKLGDHEIQNGETLTFSAWGTSGHFGVHYNIEAEFARKFARYAGRRSLSVNIDESRLGVIEDYIEHHDKWLLFENCSYWSHHLWNEVVDEPYRLKTQTLLYTPKRIQKAFYEFDCVEIDRDMSSAKEPFYYKNQRMEELQLCRQD